MWKDYSRITGGGEVRRAAKFANPSVGTTVRALTDREGKQRHTIGEVVIMLRGESFTPNNRDQYYQLLPAGHVQMGITERSVEQALFLQEVI